MAVELEPEEGSVFTFQDSDRWRTLVPKCGDVLVGELSSSTMKWSCELWASFLVLHVSVDGSGGLSCQVKSLGVSDEEASKQMSSLFNRRVGFLHLCNTCPCSELGQAALHLVEVKWFTLEGYGSFLSSAQRRQAEKWLRSFKDGGGEELENKDDPGDKVKDRKEKDGDGKEKKREKSKDQEGLGTNGIDPKKADALRKKLRKAKDNMLRGRGGTQGNDNGKKDRKGKRTSSGSLGSQSSSSSSISSSAERKAGTKKKEDKKARPAALEDTRGGTSKDYAGMLALQARTAMGSQVVTLGSKALTGADQGNCIDLTKTSSKKSKQSKSPSKSSGQGRKKKKKRKPGGSSPSSGVAVRGRRRKRRGRKRKRRKARRRPRRVAGRRGRSRW